MDTTYLSPPSYAVYAAVSVSSVESGKKLSLILLNILFFVAGFKKKDTS